MITFNSELIDVVIGKQSIIGQLLLANLEGITKEETSQKIDKLEMETSYKHLLLLLTKSRLVGSQLLNHRNDRGVNI